MQVEDAYDTHPVKYRIVIPKPYMDDGADAEWLKLPKDCILFNPNKKYPKCRACRFRYLRELGCLWCNKIYTRNMNPLRKLVEKKKAAEEFLQGAGRDFGTFMKERGKRNQTQFEKDYKSGVRY